MRARQHGFRFVRAAARKLRRRALPCFVSVFLLGIAAGIGLYWPMDTAHYLTVNASSELHDRSGRLLYAFLNENEQWQFPRPLADISPHLVNATIAVEDKRFRDHIGVDPMAIVRAALQNVTKARIHSGASTITMQVVKQADDVQRSPIGKAYQAWQAIRLERHVEKDRILDVYLNTAPYGLNLVGCESASRRYFGKPSNELTLAEAALLAGLPKSPVGLMPLRKPDAARDRRDFVLARMEEEGFITVDERARATQDPVRVAWNEFPQLAPHLAQQLKPTLPPAAQVRTTVDYTLQDNVERALAESLKQFDNEVSNAAAIVVETSTANVLARVGSANFYTTPDGGQVDACRALRSPGSALKPFTYALGIERNVLFVGEMLLDDSLDYGLYSPENYDGQYRGLVSASYALRRSLNVPSVIVLDRLGYSDLHRFLTGTGLDTLVKPAEFYGLGLTLGNCEIRLDQLTAAYCMLANLGEYRPLRQTGVSSPAPRRVLSRATCLQLYEMLGQELPEEFQRDFVQARGYLPRVCWKTGTSTGNHDAWAFLFNQHYVVGVWLGNNSGKSSKYLVGARAALPLAAQIFRSLPKRSGAEWPESGDDARDVSVCADTGLPSAKWCPHVTTARIASTQYVNRRCDVHYPKPNSEADVLERWPATSRGWDLAKINAKVEIATAAYSRKEGLQILQPADKSEFVLTAEPNADRVRVRASVDKSVDVHWYLDAQYLGVSGPNATLFVDLAEGHHELTCMDPSGNTDTVTFMVEAPYTPDNFREQAR